MAEEFEGPVIVKRPDGQPGNFEVATFEGDVGLDGTIKSTHVSAEGNISARGNVNAGETVNATRVELSGTVSVPGPSGPGFGGAGARLVRSVLKCQADDTLSVTHLVAEGNVNAGQTISANHVSAQGNISALNNVNAKNLHVEETINTQHVSAQGNISALNNVNAKNVYVKGDVILSNSDCAEEFDLEDSSIGEPPPGSVMVIGEEGSLRLSRFAYDKRVAGVISGAGTFKPGIILDRRISDRRRPAVALMGKVFCNVDTTSGPIEVGDLLTTSSTPGYAMKATDSSRAFGAVIGKALRPLGEGEGLIPILVALQ